ncbi:hypothetical protein RJ640_015220, partial [Escallonia rubra]
VPPEQVAVLGCSAGYGSEVDHVRAQVLGVDRIPSVSAMFFASLLYTLDHYLGFKNLVIKIGREKYTVGEALFQPSILGLEAHGIVEQLVRSISTVSSENHRQLLENTVLCGGTACMTGFEDRFQKEASLCSSAIRPSLVKAPEYMPENLTNYSAWVGGAILAKVVFPQNQHITKGDYDETGPSVVHRKCF